MSLKNVLSKKVFYPPKKMIVLFFMFGRKRHFAPRLEKQARKKIVAVDFVWRAFFLTKEKLLSTIFINFMLKHGNFAQRIEVKTLKLFDYQKAEERERMYHVKEPIGLDTQCLPFIDLFNKTKTSNRTTIVGWNYGYFFIQ